MAKIRVTIVDDHVMIREGLMAMLSSESEIEIVDTSSGGKEFLERIEETNPDVILLDIKMNGLSGIEVAQIVREKKPEIKIIFLTVYEEVEFAKRAFQVGAFGYILKQISADRLVETILRVSKGEKVIDPDILPHFIPGYKPQKHVVELDKLFTSREKEIIEQLIKGYSNKEISEHLNIALDTVKSHLKAIYRKLAVKNRSEAISLLYQKDFNNFRKYANKD